MVVDPAKVVPFNKESLTNAVEVITQPTLANQPKEEVKS